MTGHKNGWKWGALIALVMSAPVAAQDWTVLEDTRFGYSLPIPAGYELSVRPEAGNSRLYHDADGNILAVWAGKLEDRSFRDEVRARRQRDEEAGWDVSYGRITRDWASYSGVQAGQIRYVRAIRYCGDRTAFFLIDYALAEKERYDPIITRMVRRMRSVGAC